MRRLILPFVVPFVLTACWHESPFPLDDIPEVEVDGRLAGLWERLELEPGESMAMEVLPFDEHAYYIELRGRDADWPPDSLEVLRMRGFVSRLGGASFMNISEIQTEGPPVYRFVRFELAGDSLTVRGVTDDLEGPFESPVTLRATLLANLTVDSIFDEPAHFRKVRGLLPPEDLFELP